MLAGTDETPGEKVLYEGRGFKVYRGMGSIEAMKEGSKDRYFQDMEDDIKKLVPEGIEGIVPYKGPLKRYDLSDHRRAKGFDGILRSEGYYGDANEDEVYTDNKFRSEGESSARREDNEGSAELRDEGIEFRVESSEKKLKDYLPQSAQECTEAVSKGLF